MPQCIQHTAIQEYHCGRLQGYTKKEGQAIAKSEGISYEAFRFSGGAEVLPTFVILDVVDIVSQKILCVNASASFGKKKLYFYL